MKNKIAPLSAADYPEILKIWETSVRATHLFLTENEIAFYRPLVLKYVLPDCDLYGIFSASRLLGFLGARTGKVEMLFLGPAQRGRGLGRLLLEFALNKLKIYNIDVNEENTEALGFYLHLGYQIVSRSELDGNGKPHPILHLRYPHG